MHPDDNLFTAFVFPFLSLLLSRVSVVGREDQIQPYTGLAFLDTPPLSNGDPGLLSLPVTATGTWEPIFQVISRICSGFYASTNFEQPHFT